MLETLFLLVALSGGESEPATFEPPVQLRAGEKMMGGTRLFPSPVLFDVTGDHKPDMVIGDLIGKLTVSEREGDGWGEPRPLKGADGKPLKFHNW